MISTRELLEAAKSARGLPSNYRLARELDVPEKTVQRWNTGKNSPDDVHAAQLAVLAGLDPAEVVVSIRAERSTEPAMRSLWEGIAKKLERAGVAALAVFLSLWIGGGPDAGAQAATRASAQTAPVNISVDGSIHWSGFIRLLRALFGRSASPAYA